MLRAIPFKGMPFFFSFALISNIVITSPLFAFANIFLALASNLFPFTLTANCPGTFTVNDFQQIPIRTRNLVIPR